MARRKAQHVIQITDNYTSQSCVYKMCGPVIVKDEQADDIDKYVAGRSLLQLKEENPELLIFPEDLKAFNDGFDNRDKVICTLHPSFQNGKQSILETGNVMGWIGCGNTQLKIFSRFDSNLYEVELGTEKDNSINEVEKEKAQKKIEPKHDFFTLFILEKLGFFHLTDLDFSKGENSILENLLLLMFPAFLKNAVSQGVYKEYKTFNRNNSNIRGTIDVNKYIRFNYPFKGNVAYRTREFSYDNDVTQLIRHTIEYMLESCGIGESILNNDVEVKQCVEVIYQATPTYDVKERGQIINRNLRPKMHPYYTDYISLQKLCMQILREEGISYGINSEDKVHGILFDGAWLWEAYIFTLLENTGLGFIHPDNIAKTNALKLFKTRGETADQFIEDNRDAYPDFYNDKCVLDAKYKHLEKGVRREDLYQVISYMHTMPRNIGGYIYPYQTKDANDIIQTKGYELEGNGGLIFTVPFRIPYYDNKCDWNNFIKSMENVETEFMGDIRKLVNNTPGSL